MKDDIFAATKPMAEILKAAGFESGHHPRIRWRGQEYILVGGAITTPERFSAWEPSVAHLMDDGRIMCYGKQIGTEDDIEFLPEVMQ